MTNYSNRAECQAEDRKIQAGVSKHINKNIVLNGQSVSAKDIANTFEAVITAQDVCDELRMKLTASSKAARLAASTAKSMKSSLKAYLIAHFGESSPVLADFGFTPRKVVQKTVAEKYFTVEKQLATRAARHTMGSRQKSAIHGQVEAPVAPPAPPAQPAPQPVVANGTNGAAQSALLSLNGSAH